MPRTWINKICFGLLLAVLVLSTLAFGAVHQSILAIVYVLLTVIAVLLGIDAIRSGRANIGVNMLLVPILGAALYGAIQTISFGTTDLGGVSGVGRTISIDPFATQVAAIHFFALGVFFTLAVTLFDSALRIRFAVSFITVFGFVYAFFAILQSVLSPEAIYGFYRRFGSAPFGSFVSRNNFAAWIELAVMFPIAFLFTSNIERDKRLIYVTAAAVMGIALLVSGSRGGLVAFVSGVVFLFLLTFRARTIKGTALRVLLVLGLLGAIVAGSMFVGGESSLTRLSDEQAAAGTNVDRLHIWGVTLKIIGESFPLGNGLGSFGSAYTRFDANSGFERVEQAHNDYLQVVSDAGLPGIILGVIFLFFLIRYGIRVMRSENRFRRGIGAGALAGLFAVLVHSLFDFVLHTTAIALFFLTILAMLVASGSRFDDDIEVSASYRRARRGG